MLETPVPNWIPRLQRAHVLLLHAEADVCIATAQNLAVPLGPVRVVVLLRRRVDPLDQHGPVELRGIQRPPDEDARLVRRRAEPRVRRMERGVRTVRSDAGDEVLTLAVTPWRELDEARVVLPTVQPAGHRAGDFG